MKLQIKSALLLLITRLSVASIIASTTAAQHEPDGDAEALEVCVSGGDDEDLEIWPYYELIRKRKIAEEQTASANLITSNPILATKFIRIGFHDCVGVCDGCIDLSNPDNNGLDIPISALDSIVQKCTIDQNSGLSRADIWELAALTTADMSQSDASRVNFPIF